LGQFMADPNGQPISLGFNAHRRLERDISEMLGLAKGMLADGQVSDAETVLLHEWMAAHPDAVSCWPGDQIAARLRTVLRDGEITEAERSDLAELLSQLVGGDAGIIGSDNAATALPFDRPPPDLVYPDSVFVLTGKFAFGPRTACLGAVAKLGGRCDSDVTMRTTYLVIGTFGSRDWVHTSHGRKIEKAVEYRVRGATIAIVPEQHWISTLSA
jgi:NAD-dependent DNA ligase